MARSVLLSRFKVLLRVCYYDNGCNMRKSFLLRVPWVNEDCLVMCHRFHYRSHSCNSTWDPDSYLPCRHHYSSEAEAINHLWSFSKSDLRFLTPKNLTPFLTARAVFINIRASMRRKERRTDIDAKLLQRTIQSMWACTDSCCTH